MSAVIYKALQCPAFLLASQNPLQFRPDHLFLCTRFLERHLKGSLEREQLQEQVGLRFESGTLLPINWKKLVNMKIPPAGDMGLIPGLETKIPHAAWHSRKKKRHPALDISMFYADSALTNCLILALSLIRP